MYFEDEYLSLLSRILKDGEHKDDRTGTGTISKFGERISFQTKLEGFPLLTTKKVPFKAVLSELIWFLEGSSDERRLAEILHGTRDEDKKTIWSPNVEYTSGSSYKPTYFGDLGRIYGKQWRGWRHTRALESEETIDHGSGNLTLLKTKAKVNTIDQLRQVVDRIKVNPTDRRLIVTAWNPGELDQMALPPCHMMFQFYVRKGNFLDCQMYQRSVDTFLGLPFNMASYSVLMYIVANEVGLEPGILTMCLGDTHIYKNHIDQVEEQLSRDPKKYSAPKLLLATGVTIDNLNMNMFSLENYNAYPPIKAVMAK